MDPIVSAILLIIKNAPAEISAIMAIVRAVQGGLSTSDQAVLDAAIAGMDVKTDADVARFEADAAAHGG